MPETANAVGKIIRYDTSRYDFAQWSRSALGVGDLQRLHERFHRSSCQTLVEFMSACSGTLYRAFPLCEEMFKRLVADELGVWFGGILSCQIPPTFRVHLEDATTISPFHRDRDYGVGPYRLNVWLPLTRVWGTNSLWVESEEGRGDFGPVELDYGEAFLFDGQNLAHGSVQNNTGSTRLSFDFRFAPCRAEFDDTHLGGRGRIPKGAAERIRWSRTRAD